MATAKQTKEAIRKIRYYTHKLQGALNHAHNINVIKYDNENYLEESPCRSLGELRDRVKLSTKEACYLAFIEELKQGEY